MNKQHLRVAKTDCIHTFQTQEIEFRDEIKKKISVAEDKKRKGVKRRVYL